MRFRSTTAPTRWPSMPRLNRCTRPAARRHILPGDADLFELTDSATIYAALTLEAAGLAPRGESCRMAEAGEFAREGRMPISTLGGMKGRGNPLGAGGAYQLAEAALQLRGEASGCQVQDARCALVQSLGGPAGDGGDARA